MSSLTAAEEAQQIERVFEHTLFAGASWHVLSAKWWRSWCDYTGFDAEQGRANAAPVSARRPDAIDNAALLDPAFPADLAILRKDIMEGDDYALVEEQAALLLESWYPGPGPVLARKVITAGVRKRTRVDLHPLRFRLLACDPNTGLLPVDETAAAAAAGGIVKTLSGKAVLTDLQEELHTAATQAEGKSRRASNADMTEEDAADAKEAELKEEAETAQESRVRFWLRKPGWVAPTPAVAAVDAAAESPSAVASPASSSAMDLAADDSAAAPRNNNADGKEDEPCTALVAVSAVTDVSSSSDAAAASSSSSSSSSSIGASLPDYSRGTGYEQEWKSNYRVGPPPESLDEADNARRRLDPSEPGVRVTRLPPVVPLDDGWKLLGEEELVAPIESLELPPLNDLLVETQQMRVTRDAEGVDNLEAVWPRAAFAPIKTMKDLDVGDKVDVEDTTKSWLPAEVRGVKPGAVFVHYNGFKSSWDEWISTDSPRLAALGTHTDTSSSSSSYGSSSRSYGYGYSSYNSNDDGKPSVSGAVGLRNLGNTCFMNSIIASMSHCVPLTDYFLDDTFKRDINRTNPLGWGGRVAEEYGKLLHELWSDKYRVVAPRGFKAVISEFQPRFEGYAQHDSSELLAFLLDGLHEDLNRVRVKPATSSTDSNGRPDAVVATEAWNIYLQRNRSIIVDLLQGQFKSKVTCPIASCGRVSITFDPFQFLSVPLPVANDTVVTIHLVLADPSMPVVQVGAVVSKSARLGELREAICNAVGGGLLARRLVLADIFSGKVYRFFEADGLVSDIKANDVVFAYECPEIDEFVAKDSAAGGFHPVALLLQKREVAYMYNRPLGAAQEYRYVNYALPRVVCVPKKTQTTVRRLLEIIHSRVRPHLRGGGAPEGTAPTLAMEDAALTYTTVVTDERGEGCGVHESTGWSSNRCGGCVLAEYGRIKEREEAAAAADRAKVAAVSQHYSASTASGPLTGGTAFDVLSGADADGTAMDSDDEEDGVQVAPGGGEEGDSNGSSGSGVLVNASPSPTSQALSEAQDGAASPDGVLVSKPAEAATDADGFVSVDSNGKEGAPQPPARDLLDVPFEVKTAGAYASYLNDSAVRCAFVVRFLHVDPPVVPVVPVEPETETSVASTATPGPAASDVDMEEGRAAASDAEESPEAVSAAGEEGEMDASPTPVPVAAPAPHIWFDKSAAEREIKHASVLETAKEHVEGVNIQDCLAAFTKEETLSEEDPWYCSNCKEHRQATKKFDLWKLPEVLFIHLKRFNYSRYSRDKITTLVDFPLVGLDLAEHTVNPAHHGELYDLFAVSNHMGGLGGGHYNAFCLNHTDGQWYLHDDSSVSRVRNLGDIKSSAAYVLCYRRRQRGAQVRTEEQMATDMAAFNATLPKSSSSWSSSSDLD